MKKLVVLFIAITFFASFTLLSCSQSEPPKPVPKEEAKPAAPAPEPAKAEPAKPEPAKAEPAKPEPAKK